MMIMMIQEKSEIRDCAAGRVTMKGKLAVVSGFSGAGKGTVIDRLMTEHDGYSLSVSMTTRQPRPNEIDGVNYHFVTNETFEELVKNNGLLEHAGFVDNYYGTPRAFVEENMDAGRNVLLEIEVQGALQVKQKFPETISVFVTPPSAAELYSRLKTRGTESEEKIRKRLERAAEEVEFAFDYDYILVNDDLETAVHELRDIIIAEHAKTSNQKELLVKLQSELGGEI
jgi:guanylate kinase